MNIASLDDTREECSSRVHRSITMLSPPTILFHRFLRSSASPTLRKWSNSGTATYVIILTILIALLMYVHLPIFPIISLPLVTCVPQPGLYQSFISYWNLVLWSWLPTSGMLTFGLLTIGNIRQGKRRVAPPHGQNQLHSCSRKKDRQLIQMMFIQALGFGLTTNVYSFVSIYIASNPTDNTVEKARQAFLTNVFSLLALTGPCISFYLFTLSSELFRRELRYFFTCRQHHQVSRIQVPQNRDYN